MGSMMAEEKLDVDSLLRRFDSPGTDRLFEGSSGMVAPEFVVVVSQFSIFYKEKKGLELRKISRIKTKIPYFCRRSFLANSIENHIATGFDVERNDRLLEALLDQSWHERTKCQYR